MSMRIRTSMLIVVCSFIVIMYVRGDESLFADCPLAVIRKHLADHRVQIENNTPMAWTKVVENAWARVMRLPALSGELGLANTSVAWAEDLSLLWTLLYSDDVKCKDEAVFSAFLQIYSQTQPSAVRAFVEMQIFRVFPKEIVLSHAALLMEPYLAGCRDLQGLVLRGAPREFASLYPRLFLRQITANRETLARGDELSANDKRDCLEFNAFFGEIEAQHELIAMFLSCPATTETLSEFDSLLSDMFRLASSDSLEAVLSRFPEETGAPPFDVSGLELGSPRYDMLLGFKRLYPDDPFFVKYRDYLRGGDNPGMDEEIGGEPGVKKMFEEFQNWAKARFGYEMDLSKVTYHVNRCRMANDSEFE